MSGVFTQKGVSVLFWGFVCVYAFLVAYNADFSVIDDHTLLSTLFVGKDIPFFIIPDIGRFFPLDGQELNILSAVFGVKASVFYMFNALCVFVVVLCLQYAIRVFLQEITHREALTSSYPPPPLQINNITYIVLLSLLLSPAFSTSWLRLFVPERMEFVFLSVFLLCYAYVLRHKQATFALICGIISANIALYYKETAFAMIGAFAFVMLVCGYRKFSTQIRIFNLLLLLSSVVWLVVYYYVVLLNKQGDGFYGETPYNALLMIGKTLFSGFLNEPFLYGVVFVGLMYRIYMVFVKKSAFNPLLDSSIVASAILLLEYIVLRLGSLHYPLPAYIFALIVIGYFLGKWRWHRVGRVFLWFVGIIFISNALFVFIHFFAHYKFVPVNFQSTLGFVSQYTQENPHTRIYLEKVDRASNVEVYYSFGKWLLHYKAEDFDLMSDRAVDERLFFEEDANAMWSVFKNNEIVPKRSGDIVIITPFTAEILNMDSLMERYELLFVADYGYNVPLLGLKSFLKNAFVWLGMTKDNDMILGQNIYGLPLHFYVMRVR